MGQKDKLVIVDGNLDSNAFFEMFEKHFEPFIAHHYSVRCVFQQDGAPQQNSKIYRIHFTDTEITDIEFPVK